MTEKYPKTERKLFETEGAQHSKGTMTQTQAD